MSARIGPAGRPRIAVLFFFGLALFLTWNEIGNFTGELESVGAGLWLVLLASFGGFFMAIAWLTRTVAPVPATQPPAVEPPMGRHSESP